MNYLHKPNDKLSVGGFFATHIVWGKIYATLNVVRSNLSANFWTIIGAIKY